MRHQVTVLRERYISNKQWTLIPNIKHSKANKQNILVLLIRILNLQLHTCCFCALYAEQKHTTTRSLFNLTIGLKPKVLARRIGILEGHAGNTSPQSLGIYLRRQLFTKYKLSSRIAKRPLWVLKCDRQFVSIRIQGLSLPVV